MKRVKGFTLIELLIAVALMIIIVAVCATIFRTTTTAYTMGEARIKMYASARAAMDVIERDLISSLPSEPGSQRFWLANDNSNGPFNNGETLVNIGGALEGEKDAMLFRTMSTSAGSNMPLIVGYYLEPEFDPELGDAGAGTGITRVYNRRLFVLRRRMYELTTVPPNRLERTDSPCDLAHFILSFNIETWYDLNGPNVAPPPRFYQLDDGDINTNFYRTYIDYQTLRTNILNGIFINNDYTTADFNSPYPLGNGFPTTPDIEPTGNLYNDIKPACIRITIRMVDGAREVQERMVQRQIWLPVR